jgi:anti-sigma factor RsiW
MVGMTHQQIHDSEVIERYVRHQLTPTERQAFQEHYFACDECFDQVQMSARFIAGVREASRSGVLTAEQDERAAGSSILPAILYPNWIRNWAVPALAMSFLVAALLLGVWALSVRRENQRLARQASEQSGVAEELQRSEAKIRDLEASGTASSEQLEALRKENERLKEEIATAARRPETQVAQIRQPDANLPVINIYPLGDTQRSGGGSEVNQLRLPRNARKFPSASSASSAWAVRSRP